MKRLFFRSLCPTLYGVCIISSSMRTIFPCCHYAQSFAENISVNSLQRDLSIENTFNPPLFSLDITFKQFTAIVFKVSPSLQRIWSKRFRASSAINCSKFNLNLHFSFCIRTFSHVFFKGVVSWDKRFGKNVDPHVCLTFSTAYHAEICVEM